MSAPVADCSIAIAHHKRHTASIFAALSTHLSSCNDTHHKYAPNFVQDSLAALTHAYHHLRIRTIEFQYEGERAKEGVSTLTTSLEEVRAENAALTSAMEKHRISIGFLARRIVTHSEDDATLPPNAKVAATRQMERFTLIRDLAFAGENYARMVVQSRKLNKEGWKMSMKVEQAEKSANFGFDTAKKLNKAAKEMREHMAKLDDKVPTWKCGSEAATKMVDGDEVCGCGEKLVAVDMGIRSGG